MFFWTWYASVLVFGYVDIQLGYSLLRVVWFAEQMLGAHFHLIIYRVCWFGALTVYSFFGIHGYASINWCRHIIYFKKTFGTYICNNNVIRFFIIAFFFFISGVRRWVSVILILLHKSLIILWLIWVISHICLNYARMYWSSLLPMHKESAYWTTVYIT